jgi:isoamylase
MAEELPISLSVKDSNYVAIANDGSTAILNVYQNVPVRPVDSATLIAAQQQFACLPLETIPDITPLPFGSRMPFAHNALFVGRESHLRILAASFKDHGDKGDSHPTITAVTGLGGIGKTQLVSEFVHRYGQYFAGGVFWVSFAKDSAIPSQVAECGRPSYLDLRPDFQALPLDDQVRLVLGAWQSPLPRLLVFDNCEDEALLAQWKPPTGTSYVLITSRRAQWNTILRVKELPLGELQPANSIHLLRSYIRVTQAIDTDFAAIATELGNLPLALHLAGSFLSKFHRVVTPQAYLRRLLQVDLLADPSLASEGSTPTTMHDQHLSRTFEVSYRNLERTNSTDALALALLDRTVYFTPSEPIPHRLLLATLGNGDTSDETLLLAESALMRLLELGLIEWVNERENTLRVHPLLARFFQKKISDPRSAQAHVEKALAAQYEHIRSKSFSSAQRTLEMNRLVARIRAFAERATYTQFEIQRIFDTGTEGNRIVSLAIASMKPDALSLNSILEAIRNSRSAFEQYHALLASRELLPNLNSDQKKELALLLNDEIGTASYIKKDASRRIISMIILNRLLHSDGIQPTNVPLLDYSLSTVQRESRPEHIDTPRVQGVRTVPVYKVEPGSAHPLGATPDEHGVNFSVFADRATSVELLLFNGHEDRQPCQTIALDPLRHKTSLFWHVYVQGLKLGAHYAYRVDGPHDIHQGYCYNRNKVLIDPYAKGNTSGFWDRSAACGPDDNVETAMHSVVINITDYDWEGDCPLNHPMNKTIIYETHIRGFTQSPSSGCKNGGTFGGLIEKIPYLKKLGITAIELLPIFDFDEKEVKQISPSIGKPLTNYWGYDPFSFFAPQSSYCVAPEIGNHLIEFRDMVKALHKAEIEVILDVVLSHTGEGDHMGPTINFRGFANNVYYFLSPQDKQYYMNYSGCGNTFVNVGHRITEKLVIDALEFWVKELHIDGFHFDESVILSRDETGNPVSHAPIFQRIELSETLAHSKFIAEAWDAAGLYMVGYFPGNRWGEWNGEYRDRIRSFVKGDQGHIDGETVVGRAAEVIAGSANIFQANGELPINSINFITAHDGFTLNDLVSYNDKHNEANGEGNRDGIDTNVSWNCGAEGATDDPDIEVLRQRQVKNFAAILLLSQGVPLFVAGDEVRRTQQGNNNAYCQDNEISWFDWAFTEEKSEMLRFFQQMIAFRKSHTILQRDCFFTGQVNQRGLPDIQWHGCHLNDPGWHDPTSRVLAFTLGGFVEDGSTDDTDIHVLLNMEANDLNFAIPQVNGRDWCRFVDTALAYPNDITEPGSEMAVLNDNYRVMSHSVVILISR